MNDPIIDEIRKIRRDIELECGNDAEKYFHYFQNVQKKYKNLVRRSPKPRLKLKTKKENMTLSY